MSLATLRDIESLAADKPHGTRLKYMAGCKCLRCRAANSNYETQRAALRKVGLGNPVVATTRARNHIARLAQKGLGQRAVAGAAGLRRDTVRLIAKGEKRRARKETVDAICGVRPDAILPGTIVDGVETWRLISEMVAAGASKTEIARALGRSSQLQLRKTRVLKRNADAIKELHDKLWFRFEAMREACRCNPTPIREIAK